MAKKEPTCGFVASLEGHRNKTLKSVGTEGGVHEQQTETGKFGDFTVTVSEFRSEGSVTDH